jgi:hypothetical protein
VLDVFRFAWFAVRTLFGVIALVLTLHAALWVFVKILSLAPGSTDPGAALRRAKSYDSLPIRRGDGSGTAVTPAGRRDCGLPCRR